MLVGDHGKIISFGRFKGVAFLSVLLCSVVIAALLGLYLLYKGKAAENLRLKNQLEASQNDLMSLREEKDLLLVRMVLAEAKKSPESGRPQAEPGEKAPQETVVQAAGEEVPGAAAAAPGADKKALKSEKSEEPPVEPVRSEAPAPPDQTQQEEKLPIVDLENFAAGYDRSTGRVTATFLLKKIDPDMESVSGRAFVTLKFHPADQQQWVTMPSVSLDAGKPSPIKRGQYFSIARFKPMKFERSVSGRRTDVESATVFVFSTTGELLLQKELPVKTQNSGEVPVR